MSKIKSSLLTVKLTPEANKAMLRQQKRTRLTKREVVSIALEDADKNPNFAMPQPNTVTP